MLLLQGDLDLAKKNNQTFRTIGIVGEGRGVSKKYCYIYIL